VVENIVEKLSIVCDVCRVGWDVYPIGTGKVGWGVAYLGIPALSYVVSRECAAFDNLLHMFVTLELLVY